MYNELTEQFERAEAARLTLLKKIEDSPAEQRKKKPALETWNMIEVAEHLFNAEQNILPQLRKYGKGEGKKADFLAGIRSTLLTLFMRSPAKIKVPKAAAGIEPKGNMEFEALKNAWNDLRREMNDWVQQYPESHLGHYVFKHPVAGLMTPVQTMRFLEDHIIHHLKQIERIKRQTA
jgi:uncharacterized damage-inducible protein DinB